MASDTLAQQRNSAHSYTSLILLCLFVLTSCSNADTRGKEAADHVIISGTPTWGNGIAQLLSTKCAVCHQVPRLPSSPNNVPADMDLRFETTSGSIRAAEDIAAPLALGVLQHALNYGRTLSPIPVQTMPLSYSTPLYADEISALETWASTIITAEQASNSPVLSGISISDGELLYKRHCQGCHGLYGMGGVVNRSLRTYNANSGPAFANAIRSTAYPMNGWPPLLQFADACTPAGVATSCNGNQLDAIAAYLFSL
jgi:mono/diheme cytochrome c family protein